MCGSNARSDSIDILNYAVTLDLTAFTQAVITASCEVTFNVKEDGIEALPLDLLDLTVDSVTLSGSHLAFDHDGLLLNIQMPTPLNVGDTAEVIVYYHGHPTDDPGTFGGFVFEDGIAYNLGIGLGSTPYNFGRSWHPCFDNFVERATYDINIISNGGGKGYAVGKFLGETDLGGGMALRQFRLSQPIPTYLAGSATSTYTEVNQVHAGTNGDIPVLLVARQPDTAQMKIAFSQLGNAIDACEAWFGPYGWERVGYVLTPVGAMEHATLIAYPRFIIGGGATPDMNRLMAHELGHHWWGNTLTLACPSDMWIKEGNAEYSAQLFTEYAFGKEYFKNVVKDNHVADVLTNAHKDDDGYWPLSGIPYEHTYGTHTYRKGASVMHNLRGYLGDTLFSKGMTSMLEAYKYQSIDAEIFRDHLISATGVDLTSFFNDWIFSPGFASFEIDSVIVKPTPLPEEWKATVHVQQKLLAASHFHTDVPLEITFFDEAWNTFDASFMASGEFTTATLTIPFNPVWYILNDNNRLNLARMQDRRTVYETGNFKMNYVSLLDDITVTEAPDSAMYSLEHHWVAPDPLVPNPNNIKLSSTHYWTFGGIFPDGFSSRIRFRYFGGQASDFDYDLAGNGADDLILVWRPNPGVPWTKYPHYIKQAFVGNNGRFNVNPALPGDYAFANGDFPTASEEVAGGYPVKVYPNPSKGAFTVEGNFSGSTNIDLAVFDLMGREIYREKLSMQEQTWKTILELPQVSAGMYWLKFSDEKGGIGGVQKIIIQ